MRSFGRLGMARSLTTLPQAALMRSFPRRVQTLPKARRALSMKSSTTSKFWLAYADLPTNIKRAARKQFRLWQQNSSHPSLQFKPVGVLWSVRVTQGYRALALFEGDTYHWFWIGTH